MAFSTRALRTVSASLFFAMYCIGTPPVQSALAEDDPAVTEEEFVKSLAFKQGSVPIASGRATINVSKGFRFLDAADSAKVLEAWGNPPDSSVLGMLFPAELGPFDDGTFGVTISYEDDGHVSDAEADAIDYTKMLKDMQKSATDANPSRVKDGYDTIELIGWATAPHYDKAEKKLYWAKELKFGDEKANTLNYDIRVLGREGVLVLEAISSIKQYPVVEKKMKEVLPLVEFTQGNRYADYNASTDKLASYGIGALVSGAVLAKVGFFKGLLALLIAGKKLVVVGVVGAIAFLKRLFSGKQATPKAS